MLPSNLIAISSVGQWLTFVSWTGLVYLQQQPPENIGGIFSRRFCTLIVIQKCAGTYRVDQKGQRPCVTDFWLQPLTYLLFIMFLACHLQHWLISTPYGYPNHGMKTLSAILALCEDNPLVTGGFPSRKGLQWIAFIFSWLVAWTNIWTTVETPVRWDAVPPVRKCIHVT